MKTPTKEELVAIVAAHREWAIAGGLKGSCAYLSGANLSRADLSAANLSCADLSAADLSGAYLSGANLSAAYLSCADLSGANLSRADLSAANLSCADLSAADLSGAYLSGAYLSCANLRGTKSDAKTIWGPRAIVPETGAFVAWKRLRDGTIAELEIPAKAERVSSYVGRKCRAAYVKTIAIYRDGKKLSAKTKAAGIYDEKTVYQAGRITRPDKFDPTPLIECSDGIHFYVTRAEAEAYG
jgi:Family of unknown function (DUF5758)/Pentapeptide repeats (8 copies)